ncbi:hypothetical protein HDU86_002870 [Geranomyces michiganensis]|nr:hypothetical protein HDU86_002870 [Geranomyces michiganensis]
MATASVIAPSSSAPSPPAAAKQDDDDYQHHPAILPTPSYSRHDNSPTMTTTIFHYTHTPHRHALAHPLFASILADPHAVWGYDAEWMDGVRGVLGERWATWVKRHGEGGVGGTGRDDGSKKVEEEDVDRTDSQDDESDEEADEPEEVEEERDNGEQNEKTKTNPQRAGLDAEKPRTVSAADSAATLNQTKSQAQLPPLALAADEEEQEHRNRQDASSVPFLRRRRSSLHVLLDRAANVADLKARVRRAFVGGGRGTARGQGRQSAPFSHATPGDSSADVAASRDFAGMRAVSGTLWPTGF